MFGFLKKKLKEATDKFVREAEVVEDDAAVEESPAEQDIAKPEETQVPSEEASSDEDAKPDEKIQEEKTSPEETKKDVLEGVAKLDEKVQKKEAEPEEESKGLLKKGLSRISDRVTKVSLSQEKFDELFWELEVGLLENNVAMEVVDKIKNDLSIDLVEERIPRSGIDRAIHDSLKHSISDLFDTEKIDLIHKTNQKKPYIIAIIGINGSGKTTTIAKLVHMFKQKGMEPVVAACDTFRAAAIHQLEEHTKKLDVKLIKHDYGSDPAAVAFDAVKHAQAKNKDVVLIDTAGRLHSNKNLMQELKKILRISSPDLKIFVGESIAGNDVVEQVKLFNDAVGIDGIILSKADIDEKGGAAISVSYITGKPILYLGVGQEYDDLMPFDAEQILQQLDL